MKTVVEVLRLAPVLEARVTALETALSRLHAALHADWYDEAATAELDAAARHAAATLNETSEGVAEAPPVPPVSTPGEPADAPQASRQVQDCPQVCAECGHRHAGADLAYICIGCTCPARPDDLLARQAQSPSTEPAVAGKHCNACDTTHPRSDFAPHHATKDGLANICRKAHSDRIKGRLHPGDPAPAARPLAVVPDEPKKPIVVQGSFDPRGPDPLPGPHVFETVVTCDSCPHEDRERHPQADYPDDIAAVTLRIDQAVHKASNGCAGTLSITHHPITTEVSEPVRLRTPGMH